MSIRVVRLGSPRARGEGVRFGTVRRPPRGVPREAIATRDYYDVWFPDLAPSAALLAWVTSAPWSASRWTTFTRRYRAEMKKAPARHLLAAFAALSRDADFSIGCYCEDASRCHRSILRELLQESGADVVNSG